MNYFKTILLVTEINSDNLSYCKQIIDKFDIELRHISEFKNNFAIFDETKYYATATLQKSKPIPLVI